MNPGANFETSILGPLVILVDLFMIYIGQGSSKSGKFVIRPLISPLFNITHNMVVDTRPKL